MCCLTQYCFVHELAFIPREKSVAHFVVLSNFYEDVADKPLNISVELLRQRDTCRIVFSEEAHEVRTLLVLLEKLRKHHIQHQGAFRQLWKNSTSASSASAIWTHPGILSSLVPSFSSLILLSGHFFVVTMATCRPPGICLPTAFLNRVFTTVGDAVVPKHLESVVAVLLVLMWRGQALHSFSSFAVFSLSGNWE